MSSDQMSVISARSWLTSSQADETLQICQKLRNKIIHGILPFFYCTENDTIIIYYYRQNNQFIHNTNDSDNLTYVMTSNSSDVSLILLSEFHEKKQYCVV